MCRPPEMTPEELKASNSRFLKKLAESEGKTIEKFCADNKITLNPDDEGMNWMHESCTANTTLPVKSSIVGGGPKR